MPDVPCAEQPALRIEQREKVSSVVWQEETRPRNYGSFLILIHAVSAAIPKGWRLPVQS
jgi:methylthioribose-1-phosphate isomerase